MSVCAPNVFACKELRRRPLGKPVMLCRVCAGFGYCAAATRAFLEEAAASGAEVRFSEAVLDMRMQQVEPGQSRLAGEPADCAFAGALFDDSIREAL